MKATYKIINFLGEGSFGRAYLAQCDNDNNKYVIKQITLEGMDDEEKRETFNEAKILKKLDHPNIIKFKEVFLQRQPKPALNIVTEYADGGDLGQKIEKQKKVKVPLSEAQILDYITQICLALQHIHKKKIIHRDLKSGNIFLMKSGIVKVGDFGIAKGLQSTWEKAKTFVGTPYFLSPEIINNQPYDNKSDIWALGVLLYELMTFQMPFNAVSLPMLSIKINRGVYKAPPSTYSSDIRNLLKKCLTVNPDKRPSIDEILKLPLIKNRINNFLKEVQYDQDLHTTIAKKYKEERKKLKHKYKIVNKDKDQKNKNDNEIKDNDNIKQNNSINNSNKNDTIKMDEIKINEKNNNSNNTTKEKNENKRMESDKNKVGAFFKNKKSTRKKDVSVPNPSNRENNVQSKENNLNQKLTNDLNETNFLIQKKDPNFIQGKKYTEDEINKKIQEKGYKDLLNEKNGNLDVEKMNEDQYDQLRLLNNLHKVANNLEQDSDNELSVSSSMASSSNANEESENILIDTSNLKEDKTKNEINENKEIYKEEKKEIENIQKENEKEIGQDLVKDVINLLDKYCDKNLVQFDRKLIENKIQELKMKGYEQNKLEKAKEKIDEIFAILMKEKIM
jgi:NIMA (never in mitosis gene a)-related kinase